MEKIPNNRLNPKKHYLQVALNGTLEDAREVIFSLPKSDRIIVEAGTPFIKRYGEEGIRQIKVWYGLHLSGLSSLIEAPAPSSPTPLLSLILKKISESQKPIPQQNNQRSEKEIYPYIVADLKTMDRGETEVELAHRGGASAVIALGTAPTETLNSFIKRCEEFGIDSMIDMMNVPYPLAVLRLLKKPPSVVIIHRGVDEEKFNKETKKRTEN